MKRIALLLCFCSLAQVAVAWQRNFAENPSAEADRNRDGIPDGWTPQPAKSPAKVVWDDAVAHTGTASLRISDSANAAGKEWFDYTGRWVTNASRPVVAGKTYTLGLWIKMQDVTGDASACIAWWAGTNWLAESYTKRLRGTADWQHITIQAKAPAKATHGQVYLNLSRSKGTVWFDDVVMFQGSAPPSRFQPVDIAAACNTGFRDDVAGDGRGGWTDQGDNDARTLPDGDVAFRGVPFRILDPAKSGGKACIVLKGKGRESFPASAVIPVGRKCDTLYFLHGCAWGTKGAQVGRYELVYEGGSVVEIPLRCGREIPDWWRVADTKESAAGWEGANAQSPSVGLAILPVVNGKPSKAIQSVRVVSKGGAVLMLAAVTTADGPPVLTERPIQYEFTDTKGWYPFDFPLDDTNLDTIDLTRFLDPPAGKHGFLAVRPDGHFHFADGTRARFWGTNIGGRSPFLEKKDAATLAARLAKYGVNMLRIHAIDSRWAPLIDYAKGNSRSFRADSLDRMDFLFAELKRRGIYVYFDLLDYRRFLPGDDVRDAAQFEHGWRHSIKGATIFNDRLIELQKEFATAFLTHRNPYTKLRYVDDPAFAVLETTNENSVFYFSNTSLTLPSYVDELRQRWNRWLLGRHGDRAKLAAAWSNGAGQCALVASEDPAKGTVVLPMKHLYQDPGKAPFVGERSPARVNAMTRFFFDLERRYYGQMRAHLRKIGVRVPITGTNQTFCPASVYADSANDFVSRNNYWQHPNVHAKPFVRFNDKALVASDLARESNPVTEIASSTVVGKPMISPEFNFPWPNRYRSECLPLMAAYACLQDWDGMLFFAHSPTRKHLEHFGNQSDPVRWGQFAAAALLFHRNDVAVAKETVHVGWSQADIFTAKPSHRRRKACPFRSLPYLSKVRNAFFEKDYVGKVRLVRGTAPVSVPPATFASDTGELSLASTPGLFTINTARTKSAVGFLGKAGLVGLGDVGIECRTAFAAVMVTSLDDQAIGQSQRLLVTAVANAENTGQALTDSGRAIAEKGRPPVLAEPVDATVTIAMPDAPAAFRLDETGKRAGRVPATFADGKLRIQLKGVRSPWCEIVVIPPAP